MLEKRCERTNVRNKSKQSHVHFLMRTYHICIDCSIDNVDRVQATRVTQRCERTGVREGVKEKV